MTTFGETIAKARRDKMISQKDLASMVKKEDGEPISQQYLSDIEHGRRVPSSDHLLKQFADALDLETEVLATRAGELPEDVRRETPTKDEKQIKKAWKAFRRELK